MSDIEDKTIIITGAGKNIGRAIAENFFRKKANVVVNDILSIDKLNFPAKIISSEKFLFSQGDIASIEYQDQLIDETLKKFSKIDTLVNNVGIGSGKGFFDMEPEIMKKTIITNLISPFFLSQRIAKQIIAQKTESSIIFISSIHAKIPSGNSDYSSTKSALNMLVKEMAFELGGWGIRVNGIAPGRITDPPVEDKRIPLENTSGTSQDVANAILFLTNNYQSKYITGEILTIDGGLSLWFDRDQ